MIKDFLKWFQKEEGFTLVEALVAVGIFSVITSIAVGGFATMLRTQRQLEGLISANSNASLVLEQIARELRTGVFYCNKYAVPSDPTFENEFAAPCPEIGEVNPETQLYGPVSSFVFRNASGTYVRYDWDESNKAITRQQFGETPLRLTAQNVLVDYLEFQGIGWESSPDYHPRVTISMGVSSRQAGTEGIVTKLQTTVSTRGGSS